MTTMDKLLRKIDANMRMEAADLTAYSVAFIFPTTLPTLAVIKLMTDYMMANEVEVTGFDSDGREISVTKRRATVRHPDGNFISMAIPAETGGTRFSQVFNDAKSGPKERNRYDDESTN